MLAKLGCSYVVVGHSERREYHHEDDALVNAKVKAAFANGITPIFCCGEGLEVREAGNQVTHVLAQLDQGLAGLSAEQVQKLVIAYEPVWAIGTGKTATPEDAQEVCGAIRARLAESYGQATADATRIQYGGSVKSANIAAHHGQAGRRRRTHRRRQPGRRGVRGDLPLSRAHRSLTFPPPGRAFHRRGREGASSPDGRPLLWVWPNAGRPRDRVARHPFRED